MKKIVITGANGFLGSTITATLLQQKYSVTPLVRKGSDTSLLNDNLNIRYIDYLDPEDLKRAVKDHDVLIHNAGLTRAKNWNLYKNANVVLTDQLIEIFNDTPALKHFVFISSQAATGPSLADIPLDESSPCYPVSQYGRSKLEAEKLIQQKVKKHWTILRPASVFGPGDRDFLQIFKMIKKHIMLFPVQKEKTFSMIFSLDLAQLITRIIESPQAYDQIFFAADDEAYQQTDIIFQIEQIMNTFTNHYVVPALFLDITAGFLEIYSKLTGRLSLINRERVKEFKLNNWQVSNRKAKELLNFKPGYEIYEALHKTYHWYLEKGWI